MTHADQSRPYMVGDKENPPVSGSAVSAKPSHPSLRKAAHSATTARVSLYRFVVNRPRCAGKHSGGARTYTGTHRRYETKTQGVVGFPVRGKLEGPLFISGPPRLGSTRRLLVQRPILPPVEVVLKKDPSSSSSSFL